MNDVVRDDGSIRTPLSLFSIREGECSKCERQREGVEYQSWGFANGFFCKNCLLTHLECIRLGVDPRDLLFVRATKSVIAWLEKIEGYERVGHVFRPVNEHDEEHPPEELPTR